MAKDWETVDISELKKKKWEVVAPNEKGDYVPVSQVGALHSNEDDDEDTEDTEETPDRDAEGEYDQIKKMDPESVMGPKRPPINIPKSGAGILEDLNDDPDVSRAKELFDNIQKGIASKEDRDEYNDLVSKIQDNFRG